MLMLFALLVILQTGVVRAGSDAVEAKDSKRLIQEATTSPPNPLA